MIRARLPCEILGNTVSFQSPLFFEKFEFLDTWKFMNFVNISRGNDLNEFAYTVT